VRRITGGGAIYFDEGQLGWSLVFDRSTLQIASLADLAREICEAAAAGLRRLGVDARYRPRNDIEVDGSKLSGTGGFFDGNTLFYQGTMLVDMDVARMLAALNVPQQKLAKRALDSAAKPALTRVHVMNVSGSMHSTDVRKALARALIEQQKAQPQQHGLQQGPNGQQIIPRDWVEESTKLQATGGWTPIFPGYGYMWWMSRFGGYAALGFGGDYIFVVPELDLVVVITSGIFDYQNLFYPGELMEQYIIPSVKSESPLASNQAAADALRKAVEAVAGPQAEPVDPLPAIAAEISGKPLTVTDEGGSSTLTLMFEQGSNEFIVDTDSVIKKAGLDNIYRISEEANAFGTFPGSHKALKGRWLDENTLQVFERDIEDGFETVFTIDFEGSAFKLNIKCNLGYELNYEGTID
jgi:hypothetical protein